jgi:Tfp pilus assembly protein PilV
VEIIIIIVIMLAVLAIHLRRLGLAREADAEWQTQDKLDRDEEWEAMGVWAREHPRSKPKLPRLESLRERESGSGKRKKVRV